MRIALITYSTKPRGGVVHTLNLAEALAGLGAEVTVWSLARQGDRGFFRTVDPRVAVRLVDFPEIEGESVTDRIVRSIESLRLAFSGADYDVVHAQDCISANAVGPCIRTIHHLDEFTTPVLAECHERAVVEPYARICVSAAVAAEVFAGWGLRPTVIPNGVRADRFIAAASDVSGRRRWRDELGRYVLAVGGIEPRKGSFSLVAACDVFAFPSTKEGFGLAAMEALAAGRPVVTRDLPVLREVFGDTVGYASDPEGLAAQMAAALDDDDRAEAGRRLAESMTWETAARAHLDFYRQVTSG